MNITQKYGIISGLIIISYSVITLQVFGDISKLSLEKFKLFETLGYLRYFVLIITLYLALRAYKKNNTEPFTFRLLMKTGVVVTLYASALVGFMELVFIYLNPGFFDQYGAAYLKQIIASGAGEAEIKQTAEAIQQPTIMQTPFANGLFCFFETAFIGNIATLAFASTMRTRKQD